MTAKEIDCQSLDILPIPHIAYKR